MPASPGRRNRPSKASTPTGPRPDAYLPPRGIITLKLGDLLRNVLPIPRAEQQRLGLDPDAESEEREPRDMVVYCAGDLKLIDRPRVAVVGTRKVTREGAARARKLATELVQAGIVVVSGLADGVDTFAHEAAMAADGRTIAVIGTPLNVAYPASNRRLQERIYREHLLVSQFPLGQRVFQSNFPVRNKVMAAITDATVIIEASDTSGTLHQATECRRLGRWLFITKSVAEDKRLQWPAKFLAYANARILKDTEDVLRAISGGAV